MERAVEPPPPPLASSRVSPADGPFVVPLRAAPRGDVAVAAGVPPAHAVERTRQIGCRGADRVTREASRVAHERLGPPGSAFVARAFCAAMTAANGAASRAPFVCV